MSFLRFVYYSGVVSGWCAFVAGLFSQAIPEFPPYSIYVGIVASLVGGAVGLGLNVVAGMANPQWGMLARRAAMGVLAGAVGGACGGLVGNTLFALLKFPSCIGWMIMGLAIGCADGLYERSPRKLRNGLIGGGLGGLIGGIVFDAASGGVAARTTAFVILGVAVGTLIGLAQVLMREAWITVVDGFRPGRQLILAQDVTVLGRADHLPLPLLGFAARDVESEHARIIRRPDGHFILEDNRTRAGTRLNNQTLQGPALLNDGDLIKLGTNILRFNVRGKGSAPLTSPPATAGLPPPPPPPPSPATSTRGMSPPPPVSPAAPRPSPGMPLPPPPGPVRPDAPPSFPPRPATGGRIPPPPPPPGSMR